ncbi:MAG: desulfoferrodoxin [Pirellulales bacterium]|nr:desulfoferrodoxin [Pirellulales bacterium]
MKRRQFFTAAAGMGAGSMLAGTTASVLAADRPSEKPLQIYKCSVCGTIVEILKPGKPSLSHCGQPMELLVEKTEDKGKEKHVPVIEKIDGGYKVKVGSTAHPMLESHYIVGIELIAKDKGCIYAKALRPGDKPEAVFLIDADDVMARAYCNLHGLWKGM